MVQDEQDNPVNPAKILLILSNNVDLVGDGAEN